MKKNIFYTLFIILIFAGCNNSEKKQITPEISITEGSPDIDNKISQPQETVYLPVNFKYFYNYDGTLVNTVYVIHDSEVSVNGQIYYLPRNTMLKLVSITQEKAVVLIPPYYSYPKSNRQFSCIFQK